MIINGHRLYYTVNTNFYTAYISRFIEKLSKTGNDQEVIQPHSTTAHNTEREELHKGIKHVL